MRTLVKPAVYWHRFGVGTAGYKKSLRQAVQEEFVCRMGSTSGSGRGAFVLFEGMDRSGKTTQAKKLVEALKERNVIAEFWSFPDRTTYLGKIISSYLSGGTELQSDMVHLLFAANRFEKRKTLLEKLNSGVTIIMDRYCYSGAAFTMAKGLEGLNAEWCKSIERGKLPEPDQTYFMDIPIDVAQKRSGFGEERYEKKEFQEKVRKSFYSLSKYEDWEFIDGTNKPEDTHAKILREVMGLVQTCKTQEMGVVWSDSHQ